MNLKLKSNYHMKYILLKNINEREKLKRFLEKKSISCVSHYEPLHLSKVGIKLGKHKLNNAKNFSQRILRLPLHARLTMRQIQYVCKSIENFFKV